MIDNNMIGGIRFVTVVVEIWQAKQKQYFQRSVDFDIDIKWRNM